MRRIDQALTLAPVAAGIAAPALLGALLFRVADFHRGTALSPALQLTGMACAALPLLVVLRELRRSRPTSHDD